VRPVDGGLSGGALTLGGVALGFAFAGHWSGVMDLRR
jgi:hypothetical protein